jgi:uncharacterized RDD family membrane protein YckC
MKIPNRIPDDVQYAGFAKRLKAFAFDYLIILVYIIVLAGVNFGIILRGRLLEEIFPYIASPVVKDVIAFLTLILPVILYFTLQESSHRQGTWGKQKAGIRVVNVQGDTLTTMQAFVRSLVKFLPWQIAHTSIYQIKEFVPGGPSEPFDITGFVLVYVLVGIYILSALILKKHRTPYDWVSGAYVIVER